jgi:hypothetical protein
MLCDDDLLYDELCDIEYEHDDVDMCNITMFDDPLSICWDDAIIESIFSSIEGMIHSFSVYISFVIGMIGIIGYTTNMGGH